MQYIDGSIFDPEEYAVDDEFDDYMINEPITKICITPRSLIQTRIKSAAKN